MCETRRNSRGLDLASDAQLRELSEVFLASPRQRLEAPPLLAGDSGEGEPQPVTNPAHRSDIVGQVRQAATEAELLRIAQEAITNARKHAGAANLWVTCAVDPPFAQIEVADDGHGMSDQRPDGRYGLAIMAERAERIRGRLEITPRNPNGTRVAVLLGTSPRRGTLAAPEGKNTGYVH